MVNGCAFPTTAPGIIRRLSAICALALTVLGLGAAAATAGTDEAIETDRGFASFNDRSEIVTANDKKATKTLSIPEGAKVKLKLCYVDNEVVKKCSRPQSATAWTPRPGPSASLASASAPRWRLVEARAA